METVTVKQEEEDWRCNFDGKEAGLEVKPESDEDVDLQSARESTVPTLTNDSPTVKQEPTDRLEEAVTSEENSTLCMSTHYVCDTSIVKVEDSVTEAAVKENDAWLQQLARAYGDQEDSRQQDVKEEYDKDEETPVANNTADRKRSIPLTVSSRKFVLVPYSTGNTLAAATITRKGQERSKIPVNSKLVMKVLEDKNNIIKSNLSYSIAQLPAADNVTTSISRRISNTKPVSKVFSTAKPCLQPQHIQSPQKTGTNIVKKQCSIPDCIFQPKNKNKTCNITTTNLKPALNNVMQRSVTINRILDRKNVMTPLCMTNKAKEPGLPKQSHELLNILERLKASKHTKVFKKDTRAPIGNNQGKWPVAKVKPIPQKTIKSNPTSVGTKIREILTIINSRLPQPIEAKSSVKPIRFFISIPTSELEAFLKPCFVKLERLKVLTCDVCKEQFYLNSQFVQHVFQHVTTPSIKPNVSCNICGKYYQRKYIKIHQRLSHGPKKFWCDHCSKKFTDKGSLIKHLIIHSDVKLYRCDVCNKRFRRKSNLMSHQPMHSSDKPYNCIICDKQFRRKNSLRKHSLYHLAVRPHQCKICNKQFCLFAHLERHMLVHTGERPYACEICNKRFTRSSHRKRHMANIHISKKKYTCEICKKSFKERSLFEKHKRIHEVK